ncbi:class I SAM-dependent methyltransferase [Lutimonas saemankumensis]|uniref:class I SAM-dependent methyltransferase n=1 Tax=Lutimonas saemankumensis TaxID=483016 RepID=UPI001CD5E386|nr:class I SAM-dependent methyltransferase [Lutimonas saemankumensis]MCA0932043.1 class I SAM-dependent methyltransferase [Lutimonas saemankumensis]
MNRDILHTDVQLFINQNLNSDLTKIVLSGSPFPHIPIQELVEQIKSKSKVKRKLPTWYNTDQIFYPNSINLEQSSSEITAQYKAGLTKGKKLIDLTGGFGVDSFFFAAHFKEVFHCEINRDLSEIAAHNFQVLGAKNISSVPVNGIEYLMKSNVTFDWIYLDPSRRNDIKGKVFRLEDCLPNVINHLDDLLKFSDHIMIKLSPLLDISATIKSLNFVKEVHTIAVRNEMKELVVIIEKNHTDQIKLVAVDYSHKRKTIFKATFPIISKASYSFPETYLYEPNSAILKAGLFNEVSHQLNIDKLHINSHLYTSCKLINFPGRRFLIKDIFKYNKKKIKKLFGSKKANISIRNFNESVAEIRKKTGIKEGGEDYLFFTRDLDDQAIVIYCRKV